VTVSDALEIVLDRLMEGHSEDSDVRYVVNRFAVLREVENGSEEPTVLFNLQKSFAAYRARQRDQVAPFETKVAQLRSAITAAMPGTLDNATALLATQSGLSAQVLMDARDRLKDDIDELPKSVEGWLEWTTNWLDATETARDALLSDILDSILYAIGKARSDEYEQGDILKLLPGLRAWITGQPLNSIEVALGGNPDEPNEAEQLCLRARELVGSIIPRGLSFTFSLLTKILKELPQDQTAALDMQLIESLGTAIRKGYDSPGKLIYASKHKSILSRVQVHEEYAKGLQ
jgi:hypothetical protein